MFQPGESWLLAEGCHTMQCSADRQVVMQSHKVSCDKLEPPACRNNMPPVKVEETCGCHWECQCERNNTSFFVLVCIQVFIPLIVEFPHSVGG